MADGSNAVKFEESLKKLDLQGLILVIGLLSQRALELMVKPKQDAIIKVNAPTLTLPNSSQS